MVLKDAMISEKSLIPISLAITAAFFAFWLAGLSKDIETTASAAARAEFKATEIGASRASIDAELVGQLRSMAITINEVERMQAVHNTQMTMVLKMLERARARDGE
jgi:hypothetical protein